jgi:hypothetical protein
LLDVPSISDQMPLDRISEADSDLIARPVRKLGERLDQSSFRRKIADLGAVKTFGGQTHQSSTVRRGAPPRATLSAGKPVALFDKRILWTRGGLSGVSLIGPDLHRIQLTTTTISDFIEL